MATLKNWCYFGNNAYICE